MASVECELHDSEISLIREVSPCSRLRINGLTPVARLDSE